MPNSFASRYPGFRTKFLYGRQGIFSTDEMMQSQIVVVLVSVHLDFDLKV